MTDATTRAIAHVLRQWHNAPSAQVIPFPTKAERQLRESRKWLRTWTRPMPPAPRGDAA